MGALKGGYKDWGFQRGAIDAVERGAEARDTGARMKRSQGILVSRAAA